MTDPAPRPSRAVRHIPGSDGWPLIGSTLAFLADPEAFGRAQLRRHGKVFRTRTFFMDNVRFVDADAAGEILRDREHVFSSQRGWDRFLGRFFPGGLMLRDFDDHRLHRRVLQAAFRPVALAAYVIDQMQPVVTAALAHWPVGRQVRGHALLKQLTLRTAARVFLGVPLGDDAAAIDRDFIDLVGGSLAVLPWQIPGLRLWRALRARERLVTRLRRWIPARRVDAAPDMFSQLCRTDLRDDEIVDHLLFVLMAAHDTSTSALTTAVHALGRHPEWQDRLRAEARALPATLQWQHLESLPLADLIIKESLRMHPPVHTIPRRTVRACTVRGTPLPANAQVWVDVTLIHRDPALWADPDRFDPDRFAEPRSEHRRHPFAYLPFGAGPHACLGGALATQQARLVLFHLLLKFRWRLRGTDRFRMLPIPRPADGLQLIFEPA